MGTISYRPVVVVNNVPKEKENRNVQKFIKAIAPIVVLLVLSKYISVFQVADFIVNMFRLNLDLALFKAVYIKLTTTGLQVSMIMFMALTFYKMYCMTKDKPFKDYGLERVSKVSLEWLSILAMFK